MARLPDQARLIHLGTLHEYGPTKAGQAVRPGARPYPANAYARTKLAGSEAVLRATGSGMVNASVLRLANVCGPYPSPASFPGLLLRVFRDAAAGRSASLSIADARRDFVDVRDVAAAVVAAGDRAQARGQVMNIGSGRVMAITDLVALMAEVSGVPRRRVTERGVPAAGLGGTWSLADIGAAERLLGWRPTIPLRDSLRDMWET